MKKKKSELREFVKAIIAYSKGKSPKGLKAYTHRGDKRVEIVDILELSKVDV